MKKIKGLVIGILIGTIMSATIANAATLYNVINQGIKIVIDGQRLNPTDANGKKVEPIIYNGTTYLPVRAIASALGKEVYWDGPNYTVYLGEMGGKLEYPSLYLKDATNIGDDITTYKGTFTDNYGNTYDDVMVNVDSWGYFGRVAEYLLNMKYSRFKGTIVVPEGASDSAEKSVKFIADGKVIYTSPVITKTSYPVEFDVNIRGCNDFKIEFAGDGRYKIYLANCGFYQ